MNDIDWRSLHQSSPKLMGEYKKFLYEEKEFGRNVWWWTKKYSVELVPVRQAGVLWFIVLKMPK